MAGAQGEASPSFLPNHTHYSEYVGLDFDIYGLQNNAGSILQAYENISNMWELNGKTLYPSVMLARIEIDVDENSQLIYFRQFVIENGDTSYPAVKVSDDGLTYTAVLNQY